MTRFVASKVLQSILTILGVLTAAFFLVHLSGDPTALMLSEQASAAEVAALRSELGLDRPLWFQYGLFLDRALHAEFGNSLRQHISALSLVLDRLPATLELALTAFALGLFLAFVAVLGVRLSGSRRLRTVLFWFALTRQAIPVFWFGLLLILLFSVTLRWLPSLGRGGIEPLIPLQYRSSEKGSSVAPSRRAGGCYGCPLNGWVRVIEETGCQRWIRASRQQEADSFDRCFRPADGMRGHWGQ